MGCFFLRATGGVTGNPVSAAGLGYGLHWYCQHGQGFDFSATDSISITSCSDYSPVELAWGINSVKDVVTTESADPTPR